MILLFIVFIPSSFNLIVNSISLYVIIPLLFIYSLYKSAFLFRKFRFFRLFVILFVWMFVTGVVATDKSLYWAEIKEMTGVVMFSFILIRFCWNDPRYIYYFYILYIIKFLFIFYYAYQNGLFAVDFSSERFNLDELNANVFGYYGFFALIATFLLANYTKKFQKALYITLFFIVFALVIVAGILAASRATLLISTISFALLIIIKYLYPISFKSVLPIILIAVSIIFISKYLDTAFENSLIKARFDAKSDSRYDLLSRAYEVGSENILFGVGCGNFVLYNPARAFSHDSFAELWANNGAMGMILFILLLIEILISVRQYYKLSGDKKTSGYFIVIWTTYCFYNFFYVFYVSFFLLAFIFLIRMHVEYLKKVSRVNAAKRKALVTLNV